MLRALFRRLIGWETPTARELLARVEALEASETERERLTAEQLQELRRYYKRIQTRNGRDGDAGDDPRAAARQHLLALKLHGGGHGPV